MAEHDARRILARLAGRETDEEPIEASQPAEVTYHQIIERAVAATEDFDAATTFLARTDLDDLERAVERASADLSGRATDGERALERLRDLQQAASENCQFRSGRSSPLGDGDVAASR